VIAGGQECMSLAPHAIHLRDGKKLGNAEIIDTMIKDGLWDAFHGYHMGVIAENVATKFQVTRDEQDKIALKSQEKALKSQKENKFKEELINFKIKSKKSEVDFNKDEHPRVDINLEALKRLKPVFKKDGTVEQVEAPPLQPITKTKWLLKRVARSDKEFSPYQSKALLDAPFYSRSELVTQIFKEKTTGVHETLNMKRFINPFIKPLLCAKIPRIF
jgi:acetyl-CoA acetyltransferase